MKRYAQMGDFMPVPNAFCLNLVTATIDFYKREKKRLKYILLDKKHWGLFVEDLRKLDAEYPIDAVQGVAIDGCDVIVKKGSQFQAKEFQYEFFSDDEVNKMIAQA